MPARALAQRSASGHQERFVPRRLRARFWVRQGTFATANGHSRLVLTRSRRLVQARSDPECRFVIPDPVHPAHDLDFLGRAPAGNEGIRERHIGEIDGQRIVNDAARAGWSRGPTIGTTIRVEPCEYLIETPA